MLIIQKKVFAEGEDPEEIEYEEDNYDYSNDFYDGDNYGDSTMILRVTDDMILKKLRKKTK
jgi:hypothetical protein